MHQRELKSVVIASCVLSTSFCLAMTKPVLAKGMSADIAQVETENAPQFSLVDVRSRLFNLETLPLFLSASQGILDSADSQLSSTQLSRPSFAWIRDQVASRYGPTEEVPAEIVSQWQAYTTSEGFRYVDVVVNEPSWERLNYLRRYGFVVQFGAVARDYGYHLRIFHTGDAANRKDALSLSINNGNNSTVGSSIRLRGAYFCVPSLEALPTCGAFVAP